MAPPRRGWQRRFNSWMDQVLGRRRIEREAAESPSSEAQVFGPGTFALLGQRELDGLLVVRNDLMARYADGENMNEYPELRAAHEYFSQDATQPNAKGRTVWVNSPDDALKGMANDLLQKRLRIEDRIYPIAYNLCMYGNAYEEIMAVKDKGIVDIAQLPPPTMRRIEREDGVCLGFAQDVTMKLTTDMADLLKRSRQGDWPDHVAIFRNWQVLHWRYRPTSRMSPYGYGVTDGARWIWKRLVMMEDAMLIYKLCLRGDSKVWTPSGYRSIRDLEEGDEVYCYRKDFKLAKTKVVYKKHNGQDKIFHVKSRYRSLYANATHPVLCEINEGGVRRLEYVEVQNLVPRKHAFVTPSRDAEDFEEIEIKKPSLLRKARLSKSSVGVVERRMTYPDIAKNIGLHCYRARDFFKGEYDLISDTACDLLEANGYDPEEHLEFEDHWGGKVGPSVTGIDLPDLVNEDFARFFGFMIGDGHVHVGKYNKSGGYTGSRTGFACGDKDHINNQYKDLFASLVGEGNLRLEGDNGHRFGSWICTAKALAETMVLNGYIPGAHNKRVPEWVFRARPEIKMAFIRGLGDADGHWREARNKRESYETVELEMCNEDLLEDLRVLAMQLGLVVTRVSSRTRKGGRTIKGSTKPLPERISYFLRISFRPMKTAEPILSVIEEDTDDIWDIGVEDENHNFVADGVVVHNTRAPARFVWYVDVGQRPDDEVEAILRKAKMSVKKKKFVDPRKNQVNMRFNPLANDEDIFLAMRNGQELTRVDILQGPDYQAIDDVEYMRKKMLSVIKVPREYLGEDSTIPGRAVLSNEDVRAARVSLGIQRELRSGFENLIRIDQAARGVPIALDLEFDVVMQAPSGIYELAAMEVNNARADYAMRVRDFMSTRWILREIFDMSGSEIEALEKERKAEQEQQMAMGGMAGGGGGFFGASAQWDANPLLTENVKERDRGDLPTKHELRKMREEMRREEARRERLSQQRHDEMLNAFGRLMDQKDGEFRRRVNHDRRMMHEFKSGLLSKANKNGAVKASPASPRRPQPRFRRGK